MYGSLSNYFGPNKFGDHFVLECVLATLDMHFYACLDDKEGGATI